MSVVISGVLETGTSLPGMRDMFSPSLLLHFLGPEFRNVGWHFAYVFLELWLTFDVKIPEEMLTTTNPLVAKRQISVNHTALPKNPYLFKADLSEGC